MSQKKKNVWLTRSALIYNMYLLWADEKTSEIFCKKPDRIYDNMQFRFADDDDDNYVQKIESRKVTRWNNNTNNKFTFKLVSAARERNFFHSTLFYTQKSENILLSCVCNGHHALCF